jgi:hypothetical protein
MRGPSIEGLKISGLYIRELVSTTRHENRFDINPSITVDSGKVSIYFRRTNTSVQPISDEFGNMKTHRHGNVLKNSLHKIILDPSGKISEELELVSENSAMCIEDVRAFTDNGVTHLLGTIVIPRNEETGDPWHTKVAYSNGKIFSILSSPVGKRFEKNWVPIKSIGNHLYLVHSNNPPLTLKLDLKSLRYETSPFKNLHRNLTLSGGSPCICMPDGSLLRVARRRLALFNRGFVHISYVVKLDQNFNEIVLSRPFIFQTLGFEIANGLAMDGNQIYISWGENDSKMYLATITLESLQSWLSDNLHDNKIAYKVFRNVLFLKRFLARNLEV